MDAIIETADTIVDRGEGPGKLHLANRLVNFAAAYGEKEREDFSESICVGMKRLVTDGSIYELHDQAPVCGVPTAKSERPPKLWGGKKEYEDRPWELLSGCLSGSDPVASLARDSDLWEALQAWGERARISGEAAYMASRAVAIFCCIRAGIVSVNGRTPTTLTDLTF